MTTLPTFRRVCRGFAIVLLCGVPTVFLSGQAPPTADRPAAAPDAADVARVRREAELLHTSMHAALQLMHHRYYREDEGLPIPATVLDELFADLESERGVRLRWLVVEGQAMNVDHEAQDDFERQAVVALKAGEKAHEWIDAGTYRRAAPIRLSNHCLKCHLPDRRSTADRVAGLIVSIPNVAKPTPAK